MTMFMNKINYKLNPALTCTNFQINGQNNFSNAFHQKQW